MSEETQHTDDSDDKSKKRQADAASKKDESKLAEYFDDAAPAKSESAKGESKKDDDTPLSNQEIPLAEEQKEEEQPEQKPEKKKRSRRSKKNEDDAEQEPEVKKEAPADKGYSIFALRTTANREDQVMDFVSSNIAKRKLNVYSVVRPHGMRGYIFVEAEKRSEAEQAGFNIPYARGILRNEINYNEIEHMLEQIKKELDIRKNDIAEIISGPFKREKCKITRIDKTKEEVVVELLEAAVPIPITLRIDALKVIRRDTDDGSPDDNESED